MLRAVPLNSPLTKGDEASEAVVDDGNKWDTPATDGAVLSAMLSSYVKRWEWFSNNQQDTPPEGLHWLGK